MKTITFASWKGGTGKTTLSASCIKTLAKQGKKILVIDLDSNLSMTRVFGAVGMEKSSIDLLNGETFTPYPGHKNVWIFPSNLKISRMTNISDRTLKMSIKKLNPTGFDYLFIDPPGTMNALTRNAMEASDKIIIPAMPSEIDFEATGLVMEEMEMMGLEADVQIVLNGYDRKRNLEMISQKFTDEYGEFFYSKPISAMKSLKNLTANFSGYDLQGRAKEIIDGFVKEVVL